MASDADKVWKPLDLVKVTAEYLAGKAVPSPRLDAELLLCKAMSIARRVELYAGFERNVSPDELAEYRAMIRRRAGREPASRILGEREFMGMRFKVTPDVLSPRPETELLVEAALAHVSPPGKPEPPADEPSHDEAADPHDEALERMLDRYAEDADSDEEDEESAGERAAPRHAASKAASRNRFSPGSGQNTTPPPSFSVSGAAIRNAPARSGRGRNGVPAASDSPGPDNAFVRGRNAEIQAAAGRAVRALDLGTGSGCIAIALAAHLPQISAVAVDVSPKALAVARENALAAHVADRIEFREGDWFSACGNGETFDIILANPPYLVENDPGIWPEVAGFDPPLALYGGADGLSAYRTLARGIRSHLAPGGAAFFEVGAEQAGEVRQMLEDNGLVDLRTHRDYGGVDRIVSGRRDY